jgi:PAS domain-containing protein
MDETQQPASDRTAHRQNDPSLTLLTAPVMDVLEGMSDALYTVDEA